MLYLFSKTMDDNFQLDTKPEPPDLTPLIDVIFILLVFFLLTSTIREKILEIDLPTSSESDDNKITNELVIEVDRDNIYYIDGKEADLDKLTRIIREKAEKGDSVSGDSPFITVRSDRETDFYSIVQILDLAKRYSIKGVNFSVEAEN